MRWRGTIRGFRRMSWRQRRPSCLRDGREVVSTWCRQFWDARLSNNPLYSIYKDHQLHILDKRENGSVLQRFAKACKVMDFLDHIQAFLEDMSQLTGCSIIN